MDFRVRQCLEGLDQPEAHLKCLQELEALRTSAADESLQEQIDLGQAFVYTLSNHYEDMCKIMERLDNPRIYGRFLMYFGEIDRAEQVLDPQDGDSQALLKIYQQDYIKALECLSGSDLPNIRSCKPWLAFHASESPDIPQLVQQAADSQNLVDHRNLEIFKQFLAK